MKFNSKTQLAHYLLDRLLPVCKDSRERMRAAHLAAFGAEYLWREQDSGFDKERVKEWAEKRDDIFVEVY